jgi:hypothetical protein
MAFGRMGGRGGFGSFGILGKAGGPQSIGGTPIGTAGTGVYAGYTMVGGDDFAASLSSLLAKPDNITGRVAHNFSERDRRLTSTTSVFALADQYWTGWQDANDGVPISTFSDVLTQSSSVLSLKARQASTAEKLLIGVRDNTAAAITYVNGGDANGVNSKRPLVSAEVTMVQNFAYTGNRIVEARWRYTPGPTVGGAGNPAQALWELNVRGGSEAGDNAGAGWNDEMDWEEAHISNGNGTTRYGTALSASGNASPLLNGTWQITRITSADATMKIDTVSDTTGSILGTVTLTNSATNNAALWYAMFGSFATTTSFNENNWAAISATMDIDWIKVWTPSSSILQPQASNETVVLAFGGTGSLVLASQASLWGQAVDSEFIVPVYAYDTNAPGRSADQTAPLQTRDTLPTGVTWNSGTRTLSFGSTFSTQAGFVNLLVYPQKAGIGFVRPHVVSVVVKPKVSLTPATATPGSAYSWTVGARISAQLGQRQSSARDRRWPVCYLYTGLAVLQFRHQDFHRHRAEPAAQPERSDYVSLHQRARRHHGFRQHHPAGMAAVEPDRRHLRRRHHRRDQYPGRRLRQGRSDVPHLRQYQIHRPHYAGQPALDHHQRRREWYKPRGLVRLSK